MNVVIDPGFVAEATLRGSGTSGIGRVTESLIEALNNRDDIALSLAGFSGSDPIFRSEVSFEYAKQRFPHIARAPAVAEIPVFGSIQRAASRAYVETLVSPAAPVRRFFRRLAITPFKLFANQRQNLSFTRKETCVVHSLFTPFSGSPDQSKAARVLTVHDLFPLSHPRFCSPEQQAIAAGIVHSINSLNDWVICISEFVRSEVLRLTNVDPNRVFTIPLGVSAAFAPDRSLDGRGILSAAYGVPANDPYILNVASIQPRKNITTLVDAFARFTVRHPSRRLRLVLAGARSPEHAEVLREAGGGAAMERITFTGEVAEEHLASLYTHAAAFVFPSLFEGFGLPVLEAMACGAPVIASDNSSLPEVVGTAGILVDANDADGLAASIQQVLENAEMRDVLSKAGLKRASMFSWQLAGERHAAVYRQIADAHSRQYSSDA